MSTPPTESEMREALLLSVLADIDQCRAADGNSIEIMCDNPDADTAGEQASVVALGDFTDWEQVRYFGLTWQEALRKAADASRAFDARANK